MTHRHDRDRPWALVPAKGFTRAKSRLVPVLDVAKRALLAQAMLRDVLGAIAATRSFAGVLLVTGDQEVARMGAEYGVATLLDPSERGTGAAVQYGLDHLRSVEVGRCLVIQGDLPLVSAKELRRVLAALDKWDMVLVPAHRDGGTNILGLSRPDLIAQQFGENSLHRHLRAAADMGVAALVLRLPGAGHDIDVPSDLSLVAERGTGTHTRSLLRQFSHDGRVPTEASHR